MTGSEYLIWSNEHRAWWRPARHGYTRKLDDAGRYTRADALEICANARDGWSGRETPSELPVLADDTEECVRLERKPPSKPSARRAAPVRELEETAA